MNFDQALDIARRQEHVASIWYGMELDNEYIFIVSPHNKIIPSDTESFHIRINKITGQIEKGRMLKPTSDLIKAFESKIFIDMDENQIEKIGTV